MTSSQEPEIEARLNMTIVRAHRPLTEDELNLVRARIERDLQQREEMRSLPLANGDSPGVGYNPRIAQDGGMTW